MQIYVNFAYELVDCGAALVHGCLFHGILSIVICAKPIINFVLLESAPQGHVGASACVQLAVSNLWSMDVA